MERKNPVKKLTSINPNSPIWKRLLRIYRQSFPSSERISADDLFWRVNTGIEKIYYMLEGDQMIGFGALITLQPEQHHLIDYIAIDERYRKQGYGRELIQAIVSLPLFSSHGFVWVEVEAPESSRQEDLLSKKQRIHWYQNQGFNLVPNWTVPLPNLTKLFQIHKNHTPDQRSATVRLPRNFPTTSMHLMVYSHTNQLPNRTQVKKFLELLYTQIYRIDPASPLIFNIIKANHFTD